MRYRAMRNTQLELRERVPDSRDADLEALRIAEQVGEELEETAEVILEAFHDVVENGIENIDPNFAMNGLG